jgi:hypothetical protein
MRRILWTVALLGLMAATAWAGSDPAAVGESGVTPYGDFCEKCSRYGVAREAVPHHDAVVAIESYFHARGMVVRNVRGEGRFLRVEVYRDGRLVDRVIFDKRSGRVRSMY